MKYSSYFVPPRAFVFVLQAVDFLVLCRLEVNPSVKDFLVPEDFEALRVAQGE